MIVRLQLGGIKNDRTAAGITWALRIGFFKLISTGALSRARKSLISRDPKGGFSHTISLSLLLQYAHLKLF